jgi:hypothetical protein
MESVMKTTWKTSWVEGERELKKERGKAGNKKRICKRKWVKVGPEEDTPLTTTFVLKSY